MSELDIKALRDHLSDHEVGGQFCMADGPCPIGTMQDAERTIAALLDAVSGSHVVLKIEPYAGADSALTTEFREAVYMDDERSLRDDDAWVKGEPMFVIADLRSGEVDDYGYRTRLAAKAALDAARRGRP